MGKTYTALVMAAKRPGVIDPLAQKHGVSHKCLIDMDGRPMIERVIESLLGSRYVARIIISIEDEAALLHLPIIANGVARGDIGFAQSSDNLFSSVKAALTRADDYPALICTADNALQTSEMIDHFCEILNSQPCDAAVTVTPAELIWSKYPDGQRRPYTLTDGKFSNCNLFAIMNDAAINAAKPFEGGGQFGKSKMRILKAFGLVNLLLYVNQKLSLAGVFERVSKRLKIKIVPVHMPFAEAPIDVDNERTERLAMQVLKTRREAIGSI